MKPGYEAFEYELPEDRIAQSPLANRAASKLLHVSLSDREIVHRQFRDCLELLQAGDLLVLNDTRVTAMRVFGAKATGAQVELLLLKEVSEGAFEALVRPGKRLRAGAEVILEEGLRATIAEELSEGRRLIRFDDPGFRTTLEAISLAPLPPYVHTPLKDRERYQTVYASHGGSAAAPTAGLHFTPEILHALRAKGVQTATVTLDVGLDTFRPVSVEDPAEHTIHGERCAVHEETVLAVAGCKGRVIGVGTTAVRTLETFATGKHKLQSGETVSRLFILPGYEFKIVDGMFTNFHMPRTTMMLMISALAGGSLIRQAYAEALRHDYRFLSFGDSMLIL